ncbi:MAG: hypothetical protein RIQ50_381 [Bacteroidota bacterium]
MEGVEINSSVIAFKGIPYAVPPVGELRWKDPVAIVRWNDVLQAKQFGPRAMQTNIFGDMVFRSNGMSEDCLYLNIWMPSTLSKNPMPVLVYYYGGGFVAGDGSESRYDGASMAERGMIVVTVNYRLGVFGFLSHPELSKETSYGGSGNYGLKDQALALQWVYDHVGDLGGDPKKITIAGESAGSVSVSALMASPLSRHMIAGAIGESGSILGALPAIDLTAGEKNGKEFAAAVGAPSLAALRSLSADSILAHAQRYGLFRFERTIDGKFFPKSPLEIFEAGEQSPARLMAGWNSEEMNHRAIMGRDALTVENFKNNVRKQYGNQAETILSVYNPIHNDEVEQAATDLAGDRFISFSTWKWIDMHKRTGQPVYRYYYEQPRPGSKRAVHSAEIEYAMGNLDGNRVFQWTHVDRMVSRTMQSYFANFILTGNPNGKGLPNWNPVSVGTTSEVMHIGERTRSEKESHPERYQQLNRISTSTPQ